MPGQVITVGVSVIPVGLVWPSAVIASEPTHSGHMERRDDLKKGTRVESHERASTAVAERV